MLNDIQKKYLATSLFALANIVIAGLVIGQVFSDIGITIVKTLFGASVAVIIYAFALDILKEVKDD